MINKEQSRADYEYRSEILTIQLQRQEIMSIAMACDVAGKVGLAQDLRKILKETER
jgi:hypothetical protein